MHDSPQRLNRRVPLRVLPQVSELATDARKPDVCCLRKDATKLILLLVDMARARMLNLCCE